MIVTSELLPCMILLSGSLVHIFHSPVIGTLLLLLLIAIGLSPGGSGYFICIQNMKLVTNKFKSGGLHEKHVLTLA